MHVSLHHLQSLYTTPCPTVHDPQNYLSSTKTLLNETPYPESPFTHFLTGPSIINPTRSFFTIFNSFSLLQNSSRDLAYKPLPKAEFKDHYPLSLWLVQVNKLPELWDDVDPGLESEA